MGAPGEFDAEVVETLLVASTYPLLMPRTAMIVCCRYRYTLMAFVLHESTCRPKTHPQNRHLNQLQVETGQFNEKASDSLGGGVENMSKCPKANHFLRNNHAPKLSKY